MPGCASLLGPRTVDVPQARLQELIEKRFPVNKRLFDAIDVTLEAPHLSLEPDSNRIDIEVALRAGNGGPVRASMAGSLLVSQSLRFDAGDNTIRLSNVRVERFVVDGLPANWQRQIDRLGKPLATSLLEGQVLYALRPKDIAGLEGHGMRPADLRVTATGISITLVPIER
jgi:hypothetical protein